MHTIHVFYCENSGVLPVILIHRLKNKKIGIRFQGRSIPVKCNVYSWIIQVHFFPWTGITLELCFFTFSSRTEYVKTENIVSPFCNTFFPFIYCIEYQIRTNTKKSSEKELRYFYFYGAGTIIFYFASTIMFTAIGTTNFTMLARRFLLF